MRHPVKHLGLCLAAILCAVGPDRARGDGGTLRMVQETNGYRITIYTAPAVIRVGPIDVSVLVQDAETGNLVDNAHITVRMTSGTNPNDSIDAAATHDAATNKLLQAALLTLPNAGRWDVVVDVTGPHGEAQAGFKLDAAEPLPEWQVLWPWFSWPAVVVLLFAAQQLSGQHSRRSAIRLKLPPCDRPARPCWDSARGRKGSTDRRRAAGEASRPYFRRLPATGSAAPDQAQGR